MKMTEKKQNGFTLIEVIVVVVIVAILAAVAIPAYNNYIVAARRNAAESLAETAAAAANTFWRRTGEHVSTLGANFADSLKIYYDKEKHSITVQNENIVVTDLRNSDIKSTVPYRN